MNRHATLAVLTAFMAASGCASDPTAAGGPGPGGGPLAVDSTAVDSNLTFLRPAVTAPPLADRLVSFWAVRGQTREVRLMYRPAAGQTDSVEFARFRVEDRSLVSDSAGHPIAQGDSLLITIGVADSLRLITEFHPSGLVFSASRPARLWLKFGEADPDLNHDGLVSAADTTILLGLTIWKQEQPADPWSLLPSTVDTVSQEVEAAIPGFTRFAVAY